MFKETLLQMLFNAKIYAVLVNNSWRKNLLGRHGKAPTPFSIFRK